MPNQPWETTFNYVMLALVTTVLMVVVWVTMLRGNVSLWLWLWLLVIVSTIQALRFLAPPLVNWVRHAR